MQDKINGTKSGVDLQQKKELTFEKEKEFKYLGSTLSIKNDWSKEKIYV